MDSSTEWQSIGKTKRLHTTSQIPLAWRLPAEMLLALDRSHTQDVTGVPRTCGIMTAREIDLTEGYSATQLLVMLAEGKVRCNRNQLPYISTVPGTDVASSYDLTLAFCKRAAIAHQLVNCLSEIFFDEALSAAKAVDEHLSREGLPKGPLHGLPVSLKDHVNVKGQQSNVGVISLTKRPPASFDSSLVKILRQQGAILFSKTNVSQALMTNDSDNNVQGRTVNPQNRHLTVGGSSGGEAALVRLHGSPLGIASDLAGSARVPALVNGIFAFKPTVGRMPQNGNLEPGREGSPSPISPTFGLMAHSVQDLNLGMASIIAGQPWLLDPEAMKVAWRTLNPPNRPLRLGMILEHPRRPLHPPAIRTIQTAVELLKAVGHVVIDVHDRIPDLWEARRLLTQFCILDPQRTLIRLVTESGEPFVPSARAPGFPGLEIFRPDLDTLYEMNVDRTEMHNAYHSLFQECALDAIVMPVHQTAAAPHDQLGYSIYSGLANLLNVPAGVIPFLSARQDLDVQFDRDDVAYEPQYMPELIEGTSSGIQVVGQRLGDEELMATMETIDLCLKKRPT